MDAQGLVGFGKDLSGDSYCQPKDPESGDTGCWADTRIDIHALE